MCHLARMTFVPWSHTHILNRNQFLRLRLGPRFFKYLDFDWSNLSAKLSKLAKSFVIFVVPLPILYWVIQGGFWRDDALALYSIMRTNIYYPVKDSTLFVTWSLVKCDFLDVQHRVGNVVTITVASQRFSSRLITLSLYICVSHPRRSVDVPPEESLEIPVYRVPAKYWLFRW